MNLITETWRGLVRRKLWPVALLLVGALVAVPLALSKTPEVQPPPANLATVADGEGIPATYVTSAAEAEADAEDTGKRRRTLGDGKDPFEPAPLPKPKKHKPAKKPGKQPAAKSSASTRTESAKTETTSGGGGTSAPSTDSPVATPTATPKPSPLNSIRVRFSKVEEGGAATDEARAQLVERFEVLPDDKNPVLVYRGVEKGGKVAVFELTGNVTVEGDGACRPTPENCQFLRLRAGETEFVTVTDTGEATDAQYQIDLVKINAKR